MIPPNSHLSMKEDGYDNNGLGGVAASGTGSREPNPQAVSALRASIPNAGRGQNTSSAVMQQRSEPHDSLDDFPTPPWATRAICEHLMLLGHSLDHCSVREPAANRGFMARPLAEYFASVEASDIHDYGAGYPVSDYLFGPEQSVVNWTFCNPPFRLAEQFIARARRTSNYGVAMLVRTSFVEGAGRFERLFSVNPPSIVAQHVERVPMVKGRFDPKASTATSYCWLVWLDGEHETQFHWIAPCRRRLERAGDAQGIEAPSGGETRSGSTVGESPVAEGHAPEPCIASPNPTTQGESR